MFFQGDSSPMLFDSTKPNKTTSQHKTFVKEHQELLIVFTTCVALKDSLLVSINLNVLCVISVIALQALAGTQFPKFLFQIAYECCSIMTGYISIKLTNGM